MPNDGNLKDSWEAREQLLARTEQALEEREIALEMHRSLAERLTTLVEASDALISSLDMEQTLTNIIKYAHNLVNSADAYAIWRMDPSTTWHVVISVGLSEEFLKVGTAMGMAPPNEDMIVIEDVEAFDDKRFEERKLHYRNDGIRSVLVFPLHVRGEITGTLVFYYHTPQKFQDMDLRVTATLANISASAIEQTELYEEQRRMRSQAEAAEQESLFMASASAMLSSSLEDEKTIDSFAHLAIPYLGD